MISRRHFALGCAAIGLAGCGVRAPLAQVSGAPAGLPDDLLPSPNGAYDTWVASFQPRARSAGISDTTLREAFRGTGFLSGVVRRDGSQVELRRSLEDYLAIAVSEERITKGRAARARHSGVLAQVEARYGVDANIVTAIWGLESFYGERRGDVPVVSATSTLAFEGRRGAFFERQLLAALQIVQNGDISAANMTGSWAGAMGHTQFIPTSYQEYAVDFTGDGRRDIWSEDPSDSLASTAAYLSRNGWVSGLSWGREATAGDGGTLQPQAGGPSFAVTRNFNAIKRYNNSDSYALGVGLLADRIGGAGPLRGSFPPDANGMTKADRVALQNGLTRLGFDTQGADGVIGPNTQAALRAYQTSRGLAVTGEPSLEVLRGLR